MNRILGILLVSIMMAGCATALTTGGQAVKITKNDPQNCQEVGEVFGVGRSRYAVANARNDIRNKASELGGNVVVLDTNNQTADSVTLSGRAFKCP